MKILTMSWLLRRVGQSPKTSAGFTLIELLVVIIILGILSAIALPSFLNQVSKAQEAEGKSIVGAMNRSQQRVYLETGDFAEDLAALELGIQPKTKYYEYGVVRKPGEIWVTNKADALTGSSRRSYAGVVGVQAEQLTTGSLLCEATQRGEAIVENGDTIAGDLVCPTGTRKVR
jgi:type IV pilus assembly protein PilA